MTTLHKAAQATLEFLESGDFVYPAQLADDLRAALAQEPAQPNRSAELKSWSLLAVRALDDCHRVIETIVAESTTEEEKLDELDKRVYELFNQALCLHGVMTRSQLDKATGFGRVDVTGPITASLKANPQNLEISLRGGVIGVMTQVLEHHGIYRDGNFVLQCSF
jgi:hypothetical protein